MQFRTFASDSGSLQIGFFGSDGDSDLDGDSLKLITSGSDGDSLLFVTSGSDEDSLFFIISGSDGDSLKLMSQFDLHCCF